MEGLDYEVFVRDAFGCKVKGDDPAGLADADIYNASHRSDSFSKLKIGIGYSMLVFKRKYENEKKLRDPEDYKRMEQFIERVLDAASTADLEKIFTEYKSYMEELKNLEDRF